MNRLIRFKDVKERVGISRSTVWRMEREGKFPSRRLISKNSVAWVEKEIETWIEGRRKPNSPNVEGGSR